MHRSKLSLLSEPPHRLQRNGKRREIRRRPGAQIDDDSLQRIHIGRMAPDPFIDARGRILDPCT